MPTRDQSDRIAFGAALSITTEIQRSGDIVAYVITDTCTKDELCVQACPVDCIHPRQDEDGFADVPQLYVKPDDCIDCGACIPACPTNSIYTLDDLPAELSRFAELNAAHYN